MTDSLDKVITGSSRQDFKVRVGIGLDGHDLEEDFSMISCTASVVTSLKFANEQLQGLLAVGVLAGQFSKDCHDLVDKVSAKPLGGVILYCRDVRRKGGTGLA